MVDFCSIAGLRVGCESVSVEYKGVSKVLWGNIEHFETFGILKPLGGVSAPLQS